MEQGEIKDFTEMDKIDRVRHTHAQRHTSSSQDTSKHASKRSNTRSMVCQYYNAGTCSQQNSHETKDVTYQHVCSTQTTTAHTNPKTLRVKKSPKLLKNQANDLQLHEEVVTNVLTDSQCDSTHTIECNAHSRRNLEKDMITCHVTVEHHTPDAVSSIQTHLPIVDDCVKEEVVPLYIWDNKHNCKDYVACI